MSGLGSKKSEITDRDSGRPSDLAHDPEDTRLLVETPGPGGMARTPPLNVDEHREIAATFIVENSSRIRRRIRGKLGTLIRRTTDSEDIVSTVARRLDRYVASGRARAVSEGELWGLATKMIDAAIADYLRKAHRRARYEEQRRSTRDGLTARASVGPASGGGPGVSAEEVLRDLARNGQEGDREIAYMYARGRSHAQIARALTKGEDRVRNRWQTIKRRLRGSRDREVGDR